MKRINLPNTPGVKYLAQGRVLDNLRFLTYFALFFFCLP